MKKREEIIIYLNNIEEAVNKFNPEIISDELTEYILKRCTFISLKSNIDITILGVDQTNQLNLKNIIHNHFKQMVNKLKKVEQYDDSKRLLLLILGVVLIGVSEVFDFIVSELFLVAGWVVIWELVYNIFFERIKRNRDYYRYLQLSKSNIKFK